MAIHAYLRVSTEEQAESGAGLDAQRHACHSWAERQGTALRAEHSDEGLSGSLSALKRPGLAAAIDALQPGDVLVVAKRDRVCRGDVMAMGAIEAAIAKRKARLVSAAGEGTDDDEAPSILMRRVIDAMGEYELLMIRVRTRNALAAKKRRNERTGQVPYGKILDDDGRTLRDDPSWPQVVASIASHARDGLSLREIARRLDADNLPAKNGGKWSASSVRSILKSLQGNQTK